MLSVRDGQLAQYAATPTLEGCGLISRGHPEGVRDAGSRRTGPVATGGSAAWADTPERPRVEALLAKDELWLDGTPRDSAVDCIPSATHFLP